MPRADRKSPERVSEPLKAQDEALKVERAWVAFDELVAEFGGKVDFKPEFDTDKGRMRS